MLARTIYALLKLDAGELRRLWRDVDAAIRLITPFGNVYYDYEKGVYAEKDLGGEVFAELIPDSRLFLREALSSIGIYYLYEEIATELNAMCKDLSPTLPESSVFGGEDIGEYCRGVVEKIRENNDALKRVAFSIIDRVKELKQTSRERDLTLILNMYSRVLEEAVSSVNEVLEKFGEDPIDADDLDPFEVSLLPGEEPRIEVVDKRFNSGKRVDPDRLSTSIAAYLSILLAMHVLSQPAKAIVLVIEEPEEGLAPPQQYVFSYLLGRASKELGKDVRIVVTTHSPYVVYAGLDTGATVYYTRYSRREKGFIVSRRSFAVFALADKIALALRSTQRGEEKK
jgi:hypothetical protein